MNLIFKLSCFCIVLVFIQSCKKDDSVDPGSNVSEPTITVTASHLQQLPGGKVILTISVSAEGGLSVVKNGESEIKSYATQSKTTTDAFTYEYTIPPTQEYGKLLLNFSVTDQQDIPKTSTIPLNIMVSQWSVEDLGTPLGDIEVERIVIHPKDDNLWFVAGGNGVYVTKDGGKNWTMALKGVCMALEIDKNNPDNIYAGIGEIIYLSTDRGKKWSPKHTFPTFIASVLVSERDNSVYVGTRNNNKDNGIYKSIDAGSTWEFYSYGVTVTGLIPWDIEEDALNNKIYVSTEISNHPQPYNPPFFRSSDGGKTWEDIRGVIPWHAIKMQVHPVTHTLYAKIESLEMFYSTDFGDNWTYQTVPFSQDLLIDKNNPDRFFGANVNFAQGYTGGVFRSDNGGKSYTLMGLKGYTSGGLCLDSESTYLYVACYNHGIYRIKN